MKFPVNFLGCEASGSAGWTRILFTDYRSAGIGRATASLQVKNGLNKLQMWHLKIQWPGYRQPAQLGGQIPEGFKRFRLDTSAEIHDAFVALLSTLARDS
jgi:hypothetical protein